MRYLYYLYYVQLCPKNYDISLLNRYFVICLGHSSFQTFLTLKIPPKSHPYTPIHSVHSGVKHPLKSPLKHPVINIPVINPPFFIPPVFWGIAFSLGVPFTHTPIYPPPIADLLGILSTDSGEAI